MRFPAAQSLVFLNAPVEADLHASIVALCVHFGNTEAWQTAWAGGIGLRRLPCCLDARLMSPTRSSLRQQPLRLPLQGQDVGPYLLQRAERLRLVEVAGEADLVADLDTVRDVPGVRGVGQHLAAEESFIRLLFMRLNLWIRHFIQPFDARGLWAGWAWQRS